MIGRANLGGVLVSSVLFARHHGLLVQHPADCLGPVNHKLVDLNNQNEHEVSTQRRDEIDMRSNDQTGSNSSLRTLTARSRSLVFLLAAVCR